MLSNAGILLLPSHIHKTVEGKWKGGIRFGGNVELVVICITLEVDYTFTEYLAKREDVNNSRGEHWGTPAETGGKKLRSGI